MLLRSALLFLTHFLLLLLPVSPYSDYLTHTALDRVPATVGSDAQLRCTKIIEKQSSDYVESVQCSPEYSKDCGHVWTKGNQVLAVSSGGESTSDKYEVKSSITYDYCENFEWTTDLVQRFGIIQLIDEGSWYSRDMKCFSSALTIRNVQDADFGMYSCDFGPEEREDRDMSVPEGAYSSTQNITLFSKESGIKQEKKVEYFENFYSKGDKSDLLMQCVVTGDRLQWFVLLESPSCPRWSSPDWDQCAMDTVMKLEDLRGEDSWHCYNYTVEQHSPHDGVTEAFLYFRNICGSDWGAVFCGTDMQTRSKGGYIVQKEQWDDDRYFIYWRVLGVVGTMIPIVLILLGVFFVAGGILACVRGKVCSCCGRMPSRLYSHQPLFTPPAVRYQPIPTSHHPLQVPGQQVALQQIAVVPVSQQAPDNSPQSPAPVATAAAPVAMAAAPVAMAAAPVAMATGPVVAGGAAGYQPPVIEDTTVVHVHKARRDGEMSDEEPLIEA